MSRWWWVLAVGAVACSGDKTVPPPGDDDDDDVIGDDDDDTTPEHTAVPVVVPNYSETGIYGVERTDGVYKDGDCTTETALFVPDGLPVDKVAVILHNSLFNQDSFTDFAVHLASWGVPVLTMNLCHSGPGAVNDAVLDAGEAVLMADATGATSHFYIGHVTGGIRAVLAAEQDSNAVGVLGMDLIDDPDGTAINKAPDLTVPMLGLDGLEIACNLEGAGRDVYAAAGTSTLLTVKSADTCDFEWPASPGCLLLCARPQEGVGEGAVQRTIHGMVAAAALWQLGIDPLGEQYWIAGGQVYDDFVSDGALLP
jgi:hypothetical protein